MKKYHILSFDGGGIRGVFAAKLLDMLEKETGFLSKIDLFCGTSTGALISLSLACGFTPEMIVGLYQQLAPVLFSGHNQQSLDRAKYDSSSFKQLMVDQVFPNNPRLIDLPKKVAIMAFELSHHGRWQPHIFHNFSHAQPSAHLVDAALASSAAPLYFPSYQGFLDGGVFATNPSMSGLCLALKNVADLTLERVKLISFGSGILPDHMTRDVSWGASQWLTEQNANGLGCPFPLFSMFTEGSVAAVDFQCSALLGSSYQRINEELDTSIALDMVEKMPYLLEKAEAFPKKHPDRWRELINWISRAV